MEIQLFGKQNCGKCESTKKKLHHFVSKYAGEGSVAVSFFDLDSMDGMAEGMFRDVHEVPTTIIQDGGEDVIRWEGEIPDSEELKAHFVGRA